MKKEMMVFWCTCMLLVICSTSVLGAVGTRSTGMGGTAIVGADDAMAVYSNPAGLSVLAVPQFKLDMAFRNQNSFEYTIAYAEPDYGTGAGGLSVRYVRFPDENNDFSVSYSVASALQENIAVGMTLRYNHQFGKDSHHLTSDLGVQLGHAWPLRFGVVVRNLASMPLNEHDVKFATEIQPGIGLVLDNIGMVTLEKAEQMRLGVEVSVMDSVQLRMGWMEAEPNPWSFGTTYHQGHYGVDYSWHRNQHAIGVKWSF